MIPHLIINPGFEHHVLKALLDGRIHLFGCACGTGHKDLVEAHSAAGPTAPATPTWNLKKGATKGWLFRPLGSEHISRIGA